MLLLIDNYDSFTYNLYQYLSELGEDVLVVRNDKITPDEIEAKSPQRIVISPGPGVPERAGISNDVIRRFGPHIPILGVCLGHQAVAQAFGGKIVRASRLMHGKTSPVYHDGKAVYRQLPSPFEAGRYHSLIVEADSLPDCLYVTAHTQEGEIMGIRHKQFLIEGIQFHPESVLTPVGMTVLKNFLDLAERPRVGAAC